MSSSQEVQRRAVNAYGSFVAEESNLQDEEMPSLDDLAVPRDAVENRIAFIQTITPEERDRLLLELLSNGRGSLDYAKNLLQGSASDPNTEVPPNTGQPEWCMCGVCRPMTTPEENKCCRKRVCVTSYELFQNICIDRQVLTVAIRARCDIRVEEPDYASNSFRKAAYRQYILWRFDKLGRGNRKVCPASVLRVIREAYPALDGQYLGFRRSWCI